MCWSRDDAATSAPAISSDIFVTNAGTIIGEDGKGVGADYGSIVNSGTIIGADNSTLQRGDGDGIDVNFTVYVDNTATGMIEGLASEGVDDNGRVNTPDALAIGGGTVYNAGTIFSNDDGIIVNNDSNPDGSRSGNADLVLTNDVSGLIEGINGFAIRSENKAGTYEGSNLAAVDYDTVVNYGTIISEGAIPNFAGTFEVTTYNTVSPYVATLKADPNVIGTIEGTVYSAANAGSIRFTEGDGSAIQLGEGNDILINYGTITATDGKAINLEGGNNTLNLYAGSEISGIIDGGLGGINTLNLSTPNGVGNAPHATSGTLSEIIDFQTLNVLAGTWTVEDSETYSTGIAIEAGTLVLGIANAITAAGGVVLGVVGGGGAGTLALGANNEVASLSDTVSNNDAVLLNGHALTLSNTSGTSAQFDGTIYGAGAIIKDGTGTQILAGTNSFTGGVTINSGTLVLDAAGAAGSGAISFGGGDPPTLEFSLADVPTNAIEGFVSGDSIDITDLSASSITSQMFDTLTDVLTIDYDGDGGVPLTLTFSGAFTNDPFTVAADGSGTGLTDDIPCYVAGTRLLTASGDNIAVEQLQAGDLLVTHNGSQAKIVWLGHRIIDCSRYATPQSVWPVLVRQGAFAAGRPARDLWLSPGHSVFAEGRLMPIEKLINGATILQTPCDRVEYWHVELEKHDIIYAEGLAAESYLDTGNRAAFINGGPFIEAHPDLDPKHWTKTCVPLVFEGPELDAAKAALLARAVTLGYNISDDDDLHIIADRKRYEPVRLNKTRVAFMLPAGSQTIELRSRTFVPAYVQAGSPDMRSLGIRVGRWQLDGADCALDDDTAFASGWHEHEPGEANPGARWTTGNTPIAANTRLVVADLSGQGYYWVERKDRVVALFG